MRTQFDVRLTWFGRLSPHRPMVGPSLGVDQLENTDSVEVGDGPVTAKLLLQGDFVDHAVRGEPAAEQPLADRLAEVIEQSGRKPAGRTFDAPIEDHRR